MVDNIKNKMDNDELSVLFLGVDSDKFSNTELFSGGVSGGHKQYLIMGMVQEIRNADYKTATAEAWYEGAYEEYKAGRHYAVVNSIISQTTSAMSFYFN